MDIWLHIIIKQKVILLGSIIFRVDYKSHNKLSSSDNGNELMRDEALIRKRLVLTPILSPGVIRSFFWIFANQRQCPDFWLQAPSVPPTHNLLIGGWDSLHPFFEWDRLCMTPETHDPTVMNLRKRWLQAQEKA